MKGLVLSLFAASSFLASAAFGAAVTDVTYEGAFADAVVGPLAGNDSLGAVQGLGGAFLNDPLNPWALLDKTDSGSTPYMGVTFTLTAGMGSWTLSWAETGAPGLPLSMDLVFVTKAGPDWSAYLFEEIDFTSSPTSGNGTYTISWLNPGGQTPNLSHASLYGRALPYNPPVDVPEPATLLLMGLALLGVALSARSQGFARTEA